MTLGPHPDDAAVVDDGLLAVAADQGKQGHKHAQVGEAGSDLADGDADFRIDHGRGITANAAFKSPAESGKKAESQTQKEVRRGIVSKAGAADERTGAKADENTEQCAGREGLLEKKAAQNGADGRAEGADGHND